MHKGGHWRALGRWETPFARTIDQLGGATRVAKLLSENPETPVTVVSVYNWIAGRFYPRPAYAKRIVELSGGSLTLDQVYQHRDQVQEPRSPSVPAMTHTGRQRRA